MHHLESQHSYITQVLLHLTYTVIFFFLLYFFLQPLLEDKTHKAEALVCFVHLYLTGRHKCLCPVPGTQ